VPLTQTGETQVVTERQPLPLTSAEAAYAKQLDQPPPETVERSIALVRLQGATVLGSTGAVIDEERGVLYQSRYTADRYGPHATFHDFIDVPSARVAKPAANYFSMVSEYRGHRHFFHFLFDRLPRIHYLLSRFGLADTPFVVLTNEHPPEFQRDIFRFLEARHPNLTFVAVPERERWRLPMLYLIDDMQPVRRTFLPPDTVEYLRGLVIGGYGLSPAPPTRRRARSATSSRSRRSRLT